MGVTLRRPDVGSDADKGIGDPIPGDRELDCAPSKVATLFKEATWDSDEGLRKLYHEFHKPLFNYLWRRTKQWPEGREHAEDLVTVTIFRTAKALKGISVSGRPNAMLFRVAINELKRCYRKTFRTRAEPTELDGVALEPANDDFVEAANLRAAVQSVLDRKPNQQRKGFLLHLELDLTPREIGQELGVPWTTVQSWIWRIRKEIQMACADSDGA